MSAQACTAQARISRSSRPGRQQAAAVDVRGERRLVAQDAVAAQDVRHEVVGEDRQAVQVLEARDAREGEVGRHDLRALVEAAVGEHRHRAGQLGGQRLRRAARPARDGERVALAEEAAERAQRLRVERHELVVARLAERLGDLVGAQRAQLRRRPGAVRAEAVGERPGDREVARRARRACAASETSPSRSSPRRA